MGWVPQRWGLYPVPIGIQSLKPLSIAPDLAQHQQGEACIDHGQKFRHVTLRVILGQVQG